MDRGGEESGLSLRSNMMREVNNPIMGGKVVSRLWFKSNFLRLFRRPISPGSDTSRFRNSLRSRSWWRPLISFGMLYIQSKIGNKPFIRCQCIVTQVQFLQIAQRKKFYLMTVRSCRDRSRRTGSAERRLLPKFKTVSRRKFMMVDGIEAIWFLYKLSSTNDSSSIIWSGSACNWFLYRLRDFKFFNLKISTGKSSESLLFDRSNLRVISASLSFVWRSYVVPDIAANANVSVPFAMFYFLFFLTEDTNRLIESKMQPKWDENCRTLRSWWHVW
jgi:hypothetical protein